MKPPRRLEDIWKTDLPEGFDPMTAKELRQSLRRGSFVVPFLAVQVLALAAMVAEFMSGHEVGASEFVGILNIQLLNSSGPFWMVAGAVCMVLMPLCGLALMGQELEEGNHELLLLTHLNRWKVVAGKFASLWGLSLVTFVSLLPYGLVRYLVGGIEWWHEAACAGTVLTGHRRFLAAPQSQRLCRPLSACQSVPAAGPCPRCVHPAAAVLDDHLPGSLTSRATCPLITDLLGTRSFDPYC